MHDLHTQPHLNVNYNYINKTDQINIRKALILQIYQLIDGLNKNENIYSEKI